MKILFVNACVRGDLSNTLKLCHTALEELRNRYPDATVSEVNLAADRPQPLYLEDLQKRDALRYAEDYANPMFDYARQFAEADFILIGAPYWEMSFPAVLRIYIELISVVGITFGYTPEGQQVGKCAAGQLLYITTAGGPIGDYNLGFDFIKSLCDDCYGIADTTCFAVRNFETGADVAQLMQEGEQALCARLNAWIK